MISNITSGEWIASPEEFTTEWRVDAGTWGISICADFPGDGNVEANARLIAAAPDLLQALQLLLIVVDAPDDDPDIVRAKNAVAKATGEPQC